MIGRREITTPCSPRYAKDLNRGSLSSLKDKPNDEDSSCVCGRSDGVGTGLTLPKRDFSNMRDGRTCWFWRRARRTGGKSWAPLRSRSGFESRRARHPFRTQVARKKVKNVSNELSFERTRPMALHRPRSRVRAGAQSYLDERASAKRFPPEGTSGVCGSTSFWSLSTAFTEMEIQ